ncbi:MAG: hypothetical protein LBH01_02355 [Verrucomicrobiales bacterium]|nr:hypothetical protein [Verrucomicrobiales bacterium]
MIVKKKTWRSAIRINYLDETSPEKQRQQRQKAEIKTIGEKLQQFNDYADKDNLGRVHVGGFFHRAVAQNPDGTFTAPANLPKDEVKRRLLKNWQQHLKKAGAPRGIVQHRFVLSMSREQHDLLVKYGINPDTVLHERVRLVMKEFREKFHAGDSVGYAYGLHHDTDNLHAHIAVCPRSERLNYVGLSDQLGGKQIANGQKNQLGFLKKICERENGKLAKSFSTFAERERLLEQLKQQRNAADYFYLKAKLPPPLPGRENRKAYDELKRKHRQVRHHSRQFHGQRTLLRNAAAALAGMANPLPLEPPQVRKFCTAAMSLFSLAGRMRQSQQRLFRSRARYFHLHQTYYQPIRYAVSAHIRQTRQAQRQSVHI